MKSWYQMIMEAMPEGESLVACTLTDDELQVQFDDLRWCTCGKPFTAWSQTRVFFPMEYDGLESVGSVPRNPCDEVIDHQ